MKKTNDKLATITGRIIFEVLRLSSRLLSAGDSLVSDLGLTSARWQVLATAAFEPTPKTVSGIAHELGLARQSVQRVTNELAKAGLVKLAENPGHKRARLVVPTPAGHTALAAAEVRRIPWTQGLAAALKETDATATEAVLVQLRKALDLSAQHRSDTHKASDND